jgi:Fanconi anemia group M protein
MENKESNSVNNFIDKELLNNIFSSLRPYQREIVESIIKNGNTLVILPTGTGKTFIAFAVSLIFKPSLFLAPTKPLTIQHYKNFLNYLKAINEDADKYKCIAITGEVKKEKRAELYKYDFVFATPQTVKNDLPFIDKNHFKSLMVDECHKSVGNYAYVEISKFFDKALIAGFTASPGSEIERINEIIKNLKINNIEIRTEKDIAEFLAKKNYERIFVELPKEMKEIIAILKNLYNFYKQQLESIGFHVPNKKSEIIKIGNRIFNNENGKTHFQAIPYYVGLLNVMHMLELVETQGISSLLSYMKDLNEEKKLSVRNLVTKEEFVEIMKKCEEALQKNIEHPKLEKLLELLKNNNKKVIVFVQYTEQINRIVNLLEKNGIKAKAFIGKRHGLTKEKQQKIMEEFKNGLFNVLVSSSIGEEGIDIPEVETVIFYESVPSAIRAIQRKGRTGRLKSGKIIFLIAKDTRDESYYYAASSKERKMLAIINEIKKQLEFQRKIKEVKEEKKETHKVAQKSINEWV